MARNRTIPYNPALKQRARELRKNGTLAEVLLWKTLRKRQLGVEFHRQVPIDNYIVDFFCHELELAIEVDGITHDSEDAQQKDQCRQARLEALGLRFLRFTDHEVKNSLEGVVEAIRNACNIPLNPPSKGTLKNSGGV